MRQVYPAAMLQASACSRYPLRSQLQLARPDTECQGKSEGLTTASPGQGEQWQGGA